MDVAKIERKLASLLVTGNCSAGSKWNEYTRVRYKLRRLKESDPARYEALMSKYVGVLDEIKQTIKRGKN